MKTFSLSIVALLVGLMFFGTSETSAQKKPKKLLVAAEDLKWEQLPGGPPGVMSAPVWGDPAKGAYIGFTKFPAGFKAPLHFHTNESKITVIKGRRT